MPLTPLTPEELALLADPARRSQFVLIPLVERLIEQLEVADLTWGASSFGGSAFREVTFRGCSFAGVDFERVELRSVRFENCKFDECRFMRAQLHRTQFVGCELIETYWRESELVGCVLEGSNLSGGWFEANEMQLRLHGGSFDGVRFVRCTLDAQLNEVKVNALRLTLCTVGRLVLQYCDIDGLQLLGGSCAALLAYGGTVRDVRCGEMTCGRIEIEQVPEVETLYVNKCTVEELALLECRVSDLYVFESHTRRLSIRGGQVSGWFTHSRCDAGSLVADAELDAFFWDESECEGLTLRATRFVTGLCARGAKFRGLKLEAPQYAPDLKLVLDGAQFDGSDRFGAVAP